MSNPKLVEIPPGSHVNASKLRRGCPLDLQVPFQGLPQLRHMPIALLRFMVFAILFKK